MLLAVWFLVLFLVPIDFNLGCLQNRGCMKPVELEIEFIQYLSIYSYQIPKFRVIRSLQFHSYRTWYLKDMNCPPCCFPAGVEWHCYRHTVRQGLQLRLLVVDRPATFRRYYDKCISERHGGFWEVKHGILSSNVGSILNSVAWVSERTIQTERPQIVNEVTATFCW
jgi:hypothetical protein